MKKKITSIVELGDRVKVITVTGGPCSGKTTGLKILENELKLLGYRVLVSPEIATVLINSGITPSTVGLEEFQKQVLTRTIRQEERLIGESLRILRKGFAGKIIILCDRGAMDGMAYMGKEPFGNMVQSLGIDMHQICQARYHAVIHLRSVAVDARQFYTLANNVARSESLEEAERIDNATLLSWCAHHHVKIIDNSTDFEGKIEKLKREVVSIASGPNSIEREEKFLIKPINFAELPALMLAGTVLITQDYLALPKRSTEKNIERGVERRVRKVAYGRTVLYFYAEKRLAPKRIDDSASLRYEDEKMISYNKYKKLLRLKDNKARTIVKERTRIIYRNKILEVDRYISPKLRQNYLIMEVELESEGATILPTRDIPKCIKIVRKVTGNSKYKNRSLANV